MKQKNDNKKAQEQMGCCPMMFSAYQKYKKHLNEK